MPEQYKKEIEEILKQAGEAPMLPAEQQPRPGLLRLMRQYFRQSMGARGWSISPGRVMLTAVSLLLAALLLRMFIPGVVGPLALVGLLLFIVGYGMFFVHPRKGPEKKWRGQLIEDPSENALSMWWERFRRRLKK